MRRQLLFVIKYVSLALAVVICIYAMLNSLTLFLWGDPSLRGVPRMFHPSHIMILHYARPISETGSVSGCRYSNTMNQRERNLVETDARLLPGAYP